ncbi:alpha/beta hydrolase, partial [bacterium]
TAPGGYGRICKAFNDKGYVTVRVEKPGLGDSDGGPADKVDFEGDLDSFRQALLKTKTYDFVDPDKVVVFGHSMGGCEGPIVASEIPVKGLAVYGTVVRTWQEYTFDMYRNQSMLSGTKASEVDGQARDAVAALHLLFNEGLSPKEAKEKHPKFARAIDGFSPDGEHMSGMGMAFWQGCYAQNYASYWEKLDTNVLSIYGASDFVAERVDHPMIAEIVNGVRPGKARFVELPNSDHGFKNVASRKESQEFWGKPGKEFNPAICDLLTSWADEVTK